MDGYENKHFPWVHGWEITCIGDEYYRLLRLTGRNMSDALLTSIDMDQLLDAYHYWKILLGYSKPDFADRDGLMCLLHFDVAIELFLHRKLREKQELKLIF